MPPTALRWSWRLLTFGLCCLCDNVYIRFGRVVGLLLVALLGLVWDWWVALWGANFFQDGKNHGIPIFILFYKSSWSQGLVLLELRCKIYKRSKWRFSLSFNDQINLVNFVSYWTSNVVCNWIHHSNICIWLKRVTTLCHHLTV